MTGAGKKYCASAAKKNKEKKEKWKEIKEPAIKKAGFFLYPSHHNDGSTKLPSFRGKAMLVSIFSEQDFSQPGGAGKSKRSVQTLFFGGIGQAKRGLG